MEKKVKLEVEKKSDYTLVNVYVNEYYINSYINVNIIENKYDYYLEKNNTHITLFSKNYTTIEYANESDIND